jgi:hypothetical protein
LPKLDALNPAVKLRVDLLAMFASPEAFEGKWITALASHLPSGLFAKADARPFLGLGELNPINETSAEALGVFREGLLEFVGRDVPRQRRHLAGRDLATRQIGIGVGVESQALDLDRPIGPTDERIVPGPALAGHAFVILKPMTLSPGIAISPPSNDTVGLRIVALGLARHE